MKKIAPQWYRVAVTLNNDNAFLLVQFYSFAGAQGKQHPFADFHLLTTTFSNQGLSIPSNRQATFQEELRILGQASEALADRNDEIGSITSKMQEAFGNAAQVHATPLP